MSLSTILTTATTGLSVNQQALRTTSTNISNVNTPGYVRQRVDLQTKVAGVQTAGVEIAGINRAVDKFLQSASWSASSDASQFQSLADYYNRFESFLGDPNKNTSIPGKLDALYSTMTNLALDPTAAGGRQNALASIDAFGRTVSDLSDQIQSLRSEVSGQISDVVSQINADIKRISDLNPKIVGEKALGGDTGGMEEQRDQAISDLSKLIDIKVNTNGDGSVRVSTTSGTALVDITAYQLQYNSPGTITAGTLFDPITLHAINPQTGTPSSTGKALDSQVSSGELRGLLDMRDNVLPNFAVELGNLARTAVDQFNSVHNENTAYPAPNSLVGTNSGMVTGDTEHFTGKASFAVVDGSGVEVNRVNIDFGSYPPGTTLSTIISDVNTGLAGDGTLSMTNGVMSFTAANSANGVAIVQDPTTPSDCGGRGFSQFFGLNDLMKSDTPSFYERGVTGTDNHNFTAGDTVDLKVKGPQGDIAVDYTLTIGGTTFNDIVNNLNSSPLSTYMTFSLNSKGGLDVTPTSGNQDYKLFSVADTTNRGGTGMTLTNFFGLGEASVANAANGMGVSDAVANDNQRLALAQYDLSAAAGAPVITVGDGRGANALAALQNKTLQFGAVGDLNAMQATLGQYGASFLSNAALSSSSTQTRRDDAQALSTAVDEKLSNATGVNLDEELSHLLVYQHAYNASARVVTTAQQMMDTLINMMR